MTTMKTTSDEFESQTEEETETCRTETEETETANTETGDTDTSDNARSHKQYSNVHMPGPLGGGATQGGVAHSGGTSGLTISLPEGGGSQPAITDMHGKPMVSLPGSEHHVTRKEQKSHGSQKPVLEMMIYFLDKTGVKLNLRDGQNAEAGELFELVVSSMKFPEKDTTREAFSLWLVSDLLELQLKPNQIPFKLVCYWEELLEKYTDASPQDIERDEPVITFQRNAFYCREKEKRIQDKELLTLLYHEAKENVIDGRYPLKSAKEYDDLAGLQALIEFDAYDSATHDCNFFKSKVTQFYPEIMCRKKLTLFKSKNRPEARMPDAMKNAQDLVGNRDVKMIACKLYLEKCWRLPFYGAAFFGGQIEHPASKYHLRTVNDDPVYIAVNPDGLYVIDMDDCCFLMALTYSDLKWEYGEPSDHTNPNCLPCIFIQFKSREKNEQVTKVLQVFSRQAILTDGMIEACLKLRGQPEFEASKNVNITRADPEVWNNFNRLCLATFNSKGNLISNKARVSKK